MESTELTDGQKAVGLTFNPHVGRIAELIAAADRIDNLLLAAATSSLGHQKDAINNRIQKIINEVHPPKTPATHDY